MKPIVLCDGDQTLVDRLGQPNPPVIEGVVAMWEQNSPIYLAIDSGTSVGQDRRFLMKRLMPNKQDIFTGVIGEDTTGFGKNHPAYFTCLAKRLECDPVGVTVAGQRHPEHQQRPRSRRDSRAHYSRDNSVRYHGRLYNTGATFEFIKLAHQDLLTFQENIDVPYG